VARRAQRGPLRGVIYARVSTEEQARGFGISYSVKKVLKHFKTKGWDHVDTYADEGFSGSLEAHDRDDLNRLMTEARKTPRPFDLVGVYEERAIGRRDRAFWPWVWELEDLGIFVSITKGDYDNTTAEGRSRMRKAADKAEDERETIRDRTQGGIQEKAECGGYTGGVVPYGYRVENLGVKRESRLVPDSCEDPAPCQAHEAMVCRRARTVFVKELSWSATVTTLNSEGYRNRSGGLWTEGNLRNVMTGDAVLNARQVFRKASKAHTDADGNPIYGEQVVIDLPPIFTEEETEEFRTALEKLPRRAVPSRGRTYILSKRMASPCGERYKGWKKPGRRATYVCRGRRPAPGVEPCSCPTVDAEATEEAAWDLFAGALGDGERLRKLADEWCGVGDNPVNYEARIEQLGNQIGKLRKTFNVTMSLSIRQAIEQGLSEVEAEKEAEEATRPLNAELASLQKQRAAAIAAQTAAEAAKGRVRDLEALAEMAHERLATLDVDQRVRLLTLLDTTVTVTGPPPDRRSGKRCGVAEWFSERELLVPRLTDEAWESVADLFPPARKLDPRGLLEGLLYKARTGVRWNQLPEQYAPGSTLRNYWFRWNERELWTRAMERLTGPEGDPPYRAVMPPPMKIKTWVIPELIIESDGYLPEVSGRREFGQMAFKFMLELAS
jgi:DNA invertase Pin-like site-specific DNA recombinase